MGSVPIVTQHLGAMLDELDEKGRLRVRAALIAATFGFEQDIMSCGY